MSRNMGSPLVTRQEMEDAMAQPVPVELESVATPEPYRDFEFDLQHSRLRCAGYSVNEVSDLLALYREHMAKMAEFANAQNAIMQAGESALDL